MVASFCFQNLLNNFFDPYFRRSTILFSKLQCVENSVGQALENAFLLFPWNFMQLSFGLCFNITNWIKPSCFCEKVLCLGDGSEMIPNNQTGPILTDHNKKIIVTAGAVLYVFILYLYCNLTLVLLKVLLLVSDKFAVWKRLGLGIESVRIQTCRRRAEAWKLRFDSCLFHYLCLLYHLIVSFALILYKL